MKNMKWIILLLLSTSIHSKESTSYYYLKKAANHLLYSENLSLKKESKESKLVELIKSSGVSKRFIKKLLHLQSSNREKIKSSPIIEVQSSARVTVNKFIVHEDYDDLFDDDIYCYFFITHQDVHYAKVSQIYQGIDEGQSFFFTPRDSLLFTGKLSPFDEVTIDYGIIESDQEDIRDLQKFTQIITEVVAIIYSESYPDRQSLVIKLKEQTSKIIHALLELDSDDKLTTGSFTLRASPILATAQKELNFRHRGQSYYSDWDYEIQFRTRGAAPSL